MRLTVLGSGAVRPNPRGGSAGYLLSAGSRRYLVDCGFGVLAQLLACADPADLDGVFISHTHPDHCVDLVGIRMSLRHAPVPRRESPLPVFAAPAACADLERLGDAFEDAFWDDTIAFEPIGPDHVMDLDGLMVRFAQTRHYRPCLAMRFEHEGRSLAYTADTGPSQVVTSLAEACDVLLAEATLGERDSDESQWGHMTASEAGQMAREAGAGRLVLTHFFVENGPERLRVEAADAFGGPVAVAQEGEAHDV